MADDSGQTVIAALDDHILPLIGNLIPSLEAGIRVLDIGCGRGRALCHLASRFPNSDFVGYELSDEALDMLEIAGFNKVAVHQLDHDIQNNFYVMGKT
ncbi:MAG: class I SAM-dependent methyltransferase [Candidatus Thiodiazotropha sp. LLP2]